MADLTLSNLIDNTTDELMGFGNNQPFRPGYTGDVTPTTARVSLTNLLNRALMEMAFQTKYLVVRYGSLVLVTGQIEYAIPSAYTDVHAVYLNSVRVRRSNVSDLDNRYPKWQSATLGIPTIYYLNGMSTIGFYVRPSLVAAGMPLSLVLSKNPVRMAALTDIPEGLPEMFQDALPAKAASYMCVMDSDNPKAQKRLPQLEDRFNTAVLALAEIMRDRMTKDTDLPLFMPPALARREQLALPIGAGGTPNA